MTNSIKFTPVLALVIGCCGLAEFALASGPPEKPLPETNPPCHWRTKLNGTHVCTASGLSVVPNPGADNTRVCSIGFYNGTVRFSRIDVSIAPKRHGASAFAAYSIKEGNNPNFVNIAIDAQNVARDGGGNPLPSSDEYICRFHIEIPRGAL